MKLVHQAFLSAIIFSIFSFVTPSDSTTRNLFLKDPVQKGKDGSTSKMIVNGDAAVPGRYPYQVGLWSNARNTFCGGSLIASEWVLSAAHCAGMATHVHIGRYDLSDSNESYELIPVAFESKHPDYDVQTLENDFMVIRLQNASSYNPVTLTNGLLNLTTGTNVTVMGWGATLEGDFSGSDVLLEVEVDVVDHAVCNTAYNDTVVSDNMICASREGKDACQGDSGGPLIIKGANDSSDIQVGVVSWGYGCAREEYPGVYASVAAGLDFIQNITTCSYADGENETSFEDCCFLSCEDGNYKCAQDGCGVDSTCVDIWDFYLSYYDDFFESYYDDEYFENFFEDLYCTGDDDTYSFDDQAFNVNVCPIECEEVSTPSPTTYITQWLVGPTSYSLNVGNNYFDGSLDLTNPIGPSANLNNVAVQLFDFNCQNKKDNTNSTNAVTISSIDTSQVQSFGYSVNIDQSNIGDDTGEFVVSTGPSTGDVKFCTRVSTWEGSIEVAFRETVFALSYDLTNNTFALTNTQIQENDPDSFITDVDTDFSVLVYQCINYVKVTNPPALQQDENIVICLEPTHVGSMAHVVHISNFNVKVYAGSDTTNDYVEYNPVWFGTNGWNSNSLTDVKEKPDPEDVIMISTPVIAQFFIQGHTTIKLSGNCFLEFDSVKEARASVITAYDMEFGVEMNAEVGCFVGLMRKIRSFF